MTEFTEVWTETIKRTSVRFAETEIIRISAPNGAVVWVDSLIIEFLLPENDIERITVSGMTEDGEIFNGDYGSDEEYPHELVLLMPEIIMRQAHGN